MRVTDVKLHPMSNPKHPDCKAVCSVILDGELALHDVRIVESRGRTIVAMPSRPHKRPCPRCGGQTYANAEHCTGCGTKIGRANLKTPYRDMAHPLTRKLRAAMEERVLTAYRETVQS